MWFRPEVVTLFAVLAQVQTFTQADVEAGGRIYRSHCAECHGLRGEGGRGPDLQRGEYFHGSSDEALYRTIDQGIPGTEMPGVYFEGRQIWQLVAFVRSLARGAAAEPLPGDARRGQQIYGKLGCATCHAIGATGGRTGPELTWIGTSRPPSHLRQSILEPGAEIAERWRQVEIVDAGGKLHRGFVLNEDSFSIRLLDENANLRSFSRTQLKKVHVETRESAMPSYRGRVTDAELDDLVAYLSSLRRKVVEQR